MEFPGINPMLEAKGLFGRGLFPVDSPVLVERYNACLDSMGIPATSLSRFRVDGMGWSPEIAAEKNDPDYLCHGGAAPLAILLSPDQRGKSLYHPAFTFLRPLLQELFQRHDREIADLTSQAGVWLELDLGLSSFREPRDLLLLDGVDVRLHVPGHLLQAFREQRDMLARFMDRGDGWFDPVLRRQILESAKKNGDMRTRRFLVPDWHFVETLCYHSRAFDGVFLLRGLRTCEAVILLEGEMQSPSLPMGRAHVFLLSNPGWLALLAQERWLVLDLEGLAANSEPVRDWCDCLLAEAVLEHLPGTDPCNLNPTQRRGIVTQLGNRLSPLFHEMERVELKLERPGFLKAEDVSPEVRNRLLVPAPGLPPETRRILRRLLARYWNVNPWDLYCHNRPWFLEQFEQWSPARQEWAVSMIRKRLDALGQGEGEQP